MRGQCAVLPATASREDSPTAIVAADLFLPFLSQVFAVSFGLWTGDLKLMPGIVGASHQYSLALAAGAALAWIEGGPIRFHGFKGPLSSFAISAIIGITAGLSTADDVGRRYLIEVAASVQFAIFPVWLGAALVLGLPERGVLAHRLWSFAINLTTISGAAVLSYAALHLKAGKPRSAAIIR